MSIVINRIAILILVLSAGGALAHSAEEHLKNAEKADCSAMDGMDMSKMDKDDPVMQAMMKKCMAQMHDDRETKTKVNREGNDMDGMMDHKEREGENPKNHSDKEEPTHQH